MVDVQWGPEIPTGGVRPYWLKDSDKIVWGPNGVDLGEPRRWREWSAYEWEAVPTIRLPASHPHYAAPQPRTAPSAVFGYSEALIERMAALSGRMAETDIPVDEYIMLKGEARAIIAEMGPVDPDAELVEEMAKAIYASYEYVRPWDHQETARIHHRHIRKAAAVALASSRDHAAHLRLHAKGGTR